MKSEHRHELKTNELSRLASEWGHLSEKYVQQHTKQLVIALVVVLAAIGGFVYWKTVPGAAETQGWAAMSAAHNAAEFANIADKYPGTKVAAWARLCEADQELASGVRLLFTDRGAGRSELKKCQENYEKLVAERSTPSEVVERALFGLARCREALPPEKDLKPKEITEAAILAYQRVVDENADGVYSEPAKQRIEALKSGNAQNFYAWFDAQNPKPADREMPKDLLPPSPAAPTNNTPGANTNNEAPKGNAAAPTKAAPLTTSPAPAKSSAGPKEPAAKGPSNASGGPAVPEPGSSKPARAPSK